MDGIGLFASSKVSCLHCCEMRTQAGPEYYHQLLAACAPGSTHGAAGGRADASRRCVMVMGMLDTLKYSKHLQSAGVSQAQADAQAEALRDAVAESVATKAQLENVEQRLSAEIMQVSADVKAVWSAFGLLLGLVMTVLGMTTATLVKLLI